MFMKSRAAVPTIAPAVFLLLSVASWGASAEASDEAGGDQGGAHHHDHGAMMSHPAASAPPTAGGHEEHVSHDGEDEHAHHRAMMAQQGYRRSEHEYALVDVPLVDEDGQETTLLTALDTGKPVVVNFVYTTCATICPVMSGTFAQLQTELGSDADDLQMISVSIDPEYDTPERLRAYAQRFEAGPQWRFLTGKLDNVVAVQRAFDVYRGNKMNHEPATLMRKSADSPWIRMDGLASAAEVAGEYRRLMASVQH